MSSNKSHKRLFIEKYLTKQDHPDWDIAEKELLEAIEKDKEPEAIKGEEDAVNSFERSKNALAVTLLIQEKKKLEAELASLKSGQQKANGQEEWLCDQWKPEMVVEYTDFELADILNKNKIMPTKEYHGKEL